MAYITLNKSHFFHNLSLIETTVGSKEQIALVLKDNAYGHGLLPIAKLAQEFGIEHAVVRSIDEAQMITALFKSVIVLADTPTQKIDQNIHLVINDRKDLASLPENASIELKIDTGMHRNGVTLEELSSVLEEIKSKNLHLKGVMTHHRSADELNSDYFWQEKNFAQAVQIVTAFTQKHHLPLPRFHSQNSAAAFRGETHHDLVRIGIAAYGLLQMPQGFNQPEFRPVLSLHAKRLRTTSSKSSFKHGYSGKGRIEHDQNVSTYDAGYADGLLRLPDTATYTLPDRERFVGRVSMDNIIITGSKPDQLIFDNANDYAKVAQTIGYEVVVRLPAHLKRSVV